MMKSLMQKDKPYPRTKTCFSDKRSNVLSFQMNDTLKPVYVEHVDNWFLKIYLFK